MCGQVHATAHIWRSEIRGLWELFVFLWDVGICRLLGLVVSNFTSWALLLAPRRFLFHRSQFFLWLSKVKWLIWGYTEASGFKWTIAVTAGISPDPTCEFYVHISQLHLLKTVESFLLGVESGGLSSPWFFLFLPVSHPSPIHQLPFPIIQ